MLTADTLATIREALKAQRKYINATMFTFDTGRVAKVNAIDAALAALEQPQPAAGVPVPSEVQLALVTLGTIIAGDKVTPRDYQCLTIVRTWLQRQREAGE